MWPSWSVAQKPNFLRKTTVQQEIWRLRRLKNMGIKNCERVGKSKATANLIKKTIFHNKESSCHKAVPLHAMEALGAEVI
jgi:hypothetical protein